jgi:hypothetical protein
MARAIEAQTLGRPWVDPPKTTKKQKTQHEQATEELAKKQAKKQNDATMTNATRKRKEAPVDKGKRPARPDPNQPKRREDNVLATIERSKREQRGRSNGSGPSTFVPLPGEQNKANKEKAALKAQANKEKAALKAQANKEAALKAQANKEAALKAQANKEKAALKARTGTAVAANAVANAVANAAASRRTRKPVQMNGFLFGQNYENAFTKMNAEESVRTGTAVAANAMANAAASRRTPKPTKNNGFLRGAKYNAALAAALQNAMNAAVNENAMNAAVNENAMNAEPGKRTGGRVKKQTAAVQGVVKRRGTRERKTTQKSNYVYGAEATGKQSGSGKKATKSGKKATNKKNKKKKNDKKSKDRKNDKKKKR